MRRGTLVEVNCESDFVARTDDFQQLVQGRARRDREGRRRATDAWLQDPDGPVQQRVAAAIAQARREHGRRRASCATPGQGYVGQYIHLGGKIGVQVEFGGVTPAIAAREEFTTLVKEDRDADRRGEPAATSRATRFPRRRSRRNARSTARRWRTRASRRTSSTRSSRASSGASTRRSSCPISRRFAIRR